MVKIEIDYATMTAHIYDYKDDIVYRKIDLNICDLGYGGNISILKHLSDKLDKNMVRLIGDEEHLLLKGDKIKTIRECVSEDYKTAIATGQEPIPSNTELVVDSIVKNLYGTYITTIYNGNFYYIDPRNITLTYRR